VSSIDYMADYNEAQAAGHHPDCDGWRTAHRWEVVKLDTGTYKAICDECGELHIGSTGSPDTAARLAAGHASEVRCDGRCRSWA
jgi:hypothetical protein